jgi:hypothetical protein
MLGIHFILLEQQTKRQTTIGGSNMAADNYVKHTNENKELYFTLTELKARGWTEAIIRDQLGEPDAKRTNPCFLAAAPVCLYLRTRVASVEQSPDWSLLTARTTERKRVAAKAANTKVQRALAYVQGMDVRVTDVPLAEVTRLAIDRYNASKTWMAMERDNYQAERASMDSDPDLLASIAVNYLRIGMGQYEAELVRVFGRTGVRAAYVALGLRIIEAIGAAYPELEVDERR